jgi:hypothetical protein
VRRGAPIADSPCRLFEIEPGGGTVSCNTFDGYVEILLVEFITPRRGFDDRMVWCIDEVDRSEFDVLLRQRMRAVHDRAQIAPQTSDGEVRE